MSPYGETPKLFSLPQSVTNPSSATRCNGKPNNYFSDQNSVISVVDSEDEKDELRPSDIHVFSASSTLHGFNHIFASHHSTLRRFTWTVAFLTSLTLFLLQSSNRATYYLSYPHVTRLDEVTAGDLNFPSVTICNLNEFRFNKITTQDMYHAGSLLGILDDSDNLIKPSFYTNIENMEDGPTKDRLRAMKKKIDQLTDFDSGFVARGEFNMHEFYNRTSHDISEFLLGCKYRGRPCNHTWFTEVRPAFVLVIHNDVNLLFSE